VSRLRRWHQEHPTDGQGFWLVNLEASHLDVIAPPAVALGRRAEPPRRNRGFPSGWRWATWARPDDAPCPSIDDDPPGVVREIDTAAVLILIDPVLHELVWSCLWSQLQIARQIGRQAPGQVLAEDLARAGALSATWLQRELARAFPKRVSLLEPDIPPSCDPHLDSVELVPLGSRAGCLNSAHEATSLRTIARWLTEKVAPSENNRPAHSHIWYAGDSLDGPRHSTTDPGDHSEFSWKDLPDQAATDSLTEEMLLP
jgi:hypothetical protein